MLQLTVTSGITPPKSSNVCDYGAPLKKWQPQSGWRFFNLKRATYLVTRSSANAQKGSIAALV